MWLLLAFIGGFILWAVYGSKEKEFHPILDGDTDLYKPIGNERFSHPYRYFRVLDQVIKDEFNVTGVVRKDLNNQMGFLARVHRLENISPYVFYVNPDVDLVKLCAVLGIKGSEFTDYAVGNPISAASGKAIEDWLDANLNGYFITNKAVKDSYKQVFENAKV
jgi:hypothetical protein